MFVPFGKRQCFGSGSLPCSLRGGTCGGAPRPVTAGRLQFSVGALRRFYGHPKAAEGGRIKSKESLSIAGALQAWGAATMRDLRARQLCHLFSSAGGTACATGWGYGASLRASRPLLPGSSDDSRRDAQSDGGDSCRMVGAVARTIAPASGAKAVATRREAEDVAVGLGTSQPSARYRPGFGRGPTLASFEFSRQLAAALVDC
jgi:hypothetical protein